MTEWALLMGLSGSALFLIWWMLCRLTGKWLHARWQYAMLKLPLLLLLVPVGPCLKALWTAMRPVGDAGPSLAAHTGGALPILPAVESQLASAAPAQISVSAAAGGILGLLWLLGTAAMLIYKSAAFLRFRRRLRHAAQRTLPPRTQLLLLACQQKLGVLGAVQVTISPAAPTPLVMGLFRPVIVLPDQPLSYQELRYILLHELTHVKRGDLWVRRASMLALAIHWWNPIVHVLNRKVIELSEESCDEQIVMHLSHQERYRYGQVLLKVICSTAMPEELAAPFSTVKFIQRRLSNMLRVKTQSRRQTCFSLCMLLILLACGATTALAVRSPIAVGEEPASASEPRTDAESTPPRDHTFDLTEVEEPGGSPAASPEESDAAVPEEERDGEYGQPASGYAAGDDRDTQVPEGHAAAPEGAGNDSAAKTVMAVVSEGDQLLYTQYADGSKVNSPYYQQKLDAILDEANQTGVLINGQYPRNSSGETYGPAGSGIYGLAAAVGEAPALMAAVGTQGERGYIRGRDADSVPRDLPADACPHTFGIPLYDAEGTVIGEYSVSCGGHVFTDGKSVDAVNMEIAGGSSAPGSDVEG